MKERKERKPIILVLPDEMPWRATVIKFEGQTFLALHNSLTKERGMIALTEGQIEFFEAGHEQN